MTLPYIEEIPDDDCICYQWFPLLRREKHEGNFQGRKITFFTAFRPGDRDKTPVIIHFKEDGKYYPPEKLLIDSESSPWGEHESAKYFVIYKKDYIRIYAKIMKYTDKDFYNHTPLAAININGQEDEIKNHCLEDAILLKFWNSLTNANLEKIIELWHKIEETLNPSIFPVYLVNRILNLEKLRDSQSARTWLSEWLQKSKYDFKKFSSFAELEHNIKNRSGSNNKHMFTVLDIIKYIPANC